MTPILAIELLSVLSSSSSSSSSSYQHLVISSFLISSNLISFQLISFHLQSHHPHIICACSQPVSPVSHHPHLSPYPHIAPPGRTARKRPSVHRCRARCSSTSCEVQGSAVKGKVPRCLRLTKKNRRKPWIYGWRGISFFICGQVIVAPPSQYPIWGDSLHYLWDMYMMRKVKGCSNGQLHIWLSPITNSNQ